ncbi:class F sortase [Streptomyces kaniharaensis]|uniref:Class F sortase n=1 Tax=Streptomyces kaniharaensis TaxID=212423 RepID=A0A6N7L1Q1_9ACTN|nr:class F sortase [Streptomyces kaniharaensis]MQS16749.1 class F sortase [Streptomyces kaniharaensis]
MTSPTTPGRPPSSSEEGGRPASTPAIRPAPPRRPAALLAVAAGLALASAGSIALTTSEPGPRPRTDIGTLPALRNTASPPAQTDSTAAEPEGIHIPAIALDSPLTDLQVTPDGHLPAPDDPDQIGWWSAGPRPGGPGAAVVVGHVDSRTGPAAFYRLSDLRPGDLITIDRQDRTHVDFTVKALRQYDKDHFPDDQVYTTAGTPQLRLITCGGTFDQQRHEYRDNLVVYATLTPTTAAQPSTPPPPPPPPTDRSGN